MLAKTKIATRRPPDEQHLSLYPKCHCDELHIFNAIWYCLVTCTLCTPLEKYLLAKVRIYVIRIPFSFTQIT